MCWAVKRLIQFSLLLTCVTILVVVALVRSADASSTRWQVMTTSAGKLFESGVVLLFTGAPILEIRRGLSELTECVAQAYDEDVMACLEGPARNAAANWLVLTDYRTWLWPPDADHVEQVHLDVVMRRLRPTVRDDQCQQKDKPQ